MALCRKPVERTVVVRTRLFQVSLVIWPDGPGRQLDPNQGENLKTRKELNMATAKRTRQAALTQREYEVMEHLAYGLLYKEIAEKLHISYSAVNQHLHNIYLKLHVDNGREAMRKWLGNPPE